MLFTIIKIIIIVNNFKEHNIIYKYLFAYEIFVYEISDSHRHIFLVSRK